MKKIIILIMTFVFIPSLLCASTQGGWKNSFQQFQQDVDKAYASYRIALFQTNKKNQVKSLESALSFQQQWLAITDKYAETPPEVFAADPKWEETLYSIGDIAALGIQEILAKQLSDAHDTLEAIRDELGDLRQRNQVSIFSDHVNNYHEVMESLLHLDLKPGEIDGKILLGIREQLAVLEYLAEKMKESAPVEYLKNEKFNQAMTGVFNSLRNLRLEVNANNPKKIVKKIKLLKPAYAKIFIKFG